MRKGFVVAALVLVSLLPAAAEQGKRDLHGIGLGMTVAEIMAAAQLPCHKNWSGDVTCEEGGGSRYKAIMSGGQPAVALTVSHKFCSAAQATAVLRTTLAELSVPAGAAHSDPNGYHFDLARGGEGILDAAMGACESGGKQYQVSLRGDQLLDGAGLGQKTP